MIFFLNVGRSGSTSVAQLFDGVHEPDHVYPRMSRVYERAKNMPCYIDTSPYWLFWLDDLVQEFPDATLIHLVRDGRKVVKSFERRPDLFRKNARTYHFAWWYGRWYAELDDFERWCWYWRLGNQAIAQVAHARVRFEDLAAEPRLNVGRPHRPWAPEQEKTFTTICGELNNEYGY